MIKNLTLTILLSATMAVMATSQISTPAASPLATVSQMVGLTDVEVVYSRPAANGRTIFAADGLVPFGKIWRTAANQATKITFSEDVAIEGKDLKAGSYAILTQPGATSWAVHFYAYETGNWGSYVEKTPTLAVNVNSKMNPTHVESFTISLDDVSMAGAMLNIAWAKTIVPIKVAVHTEKQVMASIDKVMAGPSTSDYYNAGAFLYDVKGDMNKALMYVQKATKTDSPRYWQVRRESLILAALGRKSEAVEAAKLSLKLAKEAGNDDYIKMNTDSIKEWSM